MKKPRFELSKVYSTHFLHAVPATTAASKVMLPVTRYTSMVLFGRMLLWASILLVIGVLYWVITNRAHDSKSRLVFSSIQQLGNLQNIMKNPHFQGLDSHNKPYTVIADQSVQKDENTYLLDNISADMISENGQWEALKAGNGLVNKPAQTVMLYNHVDMFYEGGYEFRSDHAFVDIQANTVVGDSPVEGQGPTGTIKADTFKLLDGGQVIQFNGSVKVKLYR